MRILITNRQLNEASGTVTYVQDLACAFFEKGHEVAVYTSQIGRAARWLRSQGIFVTHSLRKIPWVPDIIHGHHTTETTEAALYFPHTPTLFFCHDRLSPNDAPPFSPNIVQYIAVDANCLQRLHHEFLIEEHQTKILYNFVNLKSFQPRLPLPPKPSKALLFSNYAKPHSLFPVIMSACEQAGLNLDVMGAGMNRYQEAPEHFLKDYDVVFAKAKCAIEAMAVGCAVVVCDASGVGGMVQPKNFVPFRHFNFGMKLMTKLLTPNVLAAEIAKYDPFEATFVTRQIRQKASLERFLSHITDAYRDAMNIPFQSDAREALYLKAFKKRAPFRLFRKGVYMAFRMAPWLRKLLLAYRHSLVG